MTTISVSGHEKAHRRGFGGVFLGTVCFYAGPNRRAPGPRGRRDGFPVVQGGAGAAGTAPAERREALGRLVQVEFRLYDHILHVAVELEAEALAYALHGAVVQQDLGGDAPEVLVAADLEEASD